MKIKRFFAADIRQAMRMVKEELGADAVIMSNRTVDGGIEIVAAQDFDEQSIHNTLQEQTTEQQSAAAHTAKKIVLPNFDAAKKRLQLLDNQKKQRAATFVPELAYRNNDNPLPEQTTEQQAPETNTKKMVLPNFDAAKNRLQDGQRNQSAAALMSEQPVRQNIDQYVGYAERIQLRGKPE